jgi:superoxide dismutase, Cu-Zn family
MKKLFRNFMGALGALALMGVLVGCPQERQRVSDVDPMEPGTFLPRTQSVSYAVVHLQPTEGNKAHGTVYVRDHESGVHLHGEIEGLTPGSLHGFHVHEFGDCSGAAAEAAGSHFDPLGFPHGSLQDPTTHAGDLGNIEANAEGVAEVNIISPYLELDRIETEVRILGRSLIVHEREDDLETQPAGDAGPAIACGVIGVSTSPQIPAE